MRIIIIKFGLVLCSLVCFSMNLHAEPNTSVLICEFQTNGYLNWKSEYKHKSETKSSEYSVTIPELWMSPSSKDGMVSKYKYTNILTGFSGKFDLVLNGRMITAIEKSISDNAIILHIWLDKKGIPNNSFEATKVFLGHSRLIEEYEASSINYGFCRNAT
jgi:hypothetical protein